jgi:hypothetical protein
MKYGAGGLAMNSSASFLMELHPRGGTWREAAPEKWTKDKMQSRAKENL